MPTFDPTLKDAVVATTNFSTYRTCSMKLPAVANVIGAGAGLSVITAVTFNPHLPADATNICIHVTPNQDAVANVTAVTTAGFTFTLLPRLAANTLAVGSNMITVSWDQNEI